MKKKTGITVILAVTKDGSVLGFVPPEALIVVHWKSST
jgi:hypothetical protein